jgi:hypothetical protein
MSNDDSLKSLAFLVLSRESGMEHSGGTLLERPSGRQATTKAACSTELASGHGCSAVPGPGCGTVEHPAPSVELRDVRAECLPLLIGQWLRTPAEVFTRAIGLCCE